MFRSKYPIFKKGRLLKIEMLESLRDYSKDIVEIMTNGCKEGVCYGCNAVVKNNKLFIEPGMLYYKGLLYLLKREQEVACENNNKLTIIKVVNTDKSGSVDYHEKVADIIASNNECEHGEIELCRFTLREGATLRHEYMNFADCNTQYDTIITLNVNYIYNNEVTLRPEIMLKFASELIKCSSDAMDFMFGTIIINNNGKVAKEAIINYINKKEVGSSSTYDNVDCYNKLLQILNYVSGKTNRITTESRMRRGILLE